MLVLWVDPLSGGTVGRCVVFSAFVSRPGDTGLIDRYTCGIALQCEGVIEVSVGDGSAGVGYCIGI